MLVLICRFIFLIILYTFKVNILLTKNRSAFLKWFYVSFKTTMSYFSSHYGNKTEENKQTNKIKESMT